MPKTKSISGFTTICITTDENSVTVRVSPVIRLIREPEVITSPCCGESESIFRNSDFLRSLPNLCE